MADTRIPPFRRIVWAHYKKHGRHDLPWRKTRDAYKILVSEVMLQQTQVERVVPYYRAFLEKFPTARRLAEAPLSEVLKVWQGLGYNRRAKLLHAAAREIAKGGIPFLSYRTKMVFSESRAKELSMPRSSTQLTPIRGSLAGELEKLPGVGPYTARAVAAFAFDEPSIFVETNIRTAVIHHFFSKPRGAWNAQRSRKPLKVKTPDKHRYHICIYGNGSAARISDAEMADILAAALPKDATRVRKWYSALMDYGAFLKRSGVRVNAASAHYVKQSAFKGSAREARGAILRKLAKGSGAMKELCGLFGGERRAQMRAALAALRTEGMIEKRGARYRLAD